jgi:hypothetical protein
LLRRCNDVRQTSGAAGIRQAHALPFATTATAEVAVPLALAWATRAIGAPPLRTRAGPANERGRLAPPPGPPADARRYFANARYFASK